ncbi:protein PPP4R3C-like, partial [Nannospalax galili]|uniref:protein PPP4R3C-like n=1 Tax=Nannospalax galili TaxID=1026970 RepID=UPI000819E147
CQQIWQDICQVQGKDPSVESTQNLSHDIETFENIPEIRDMVEMPKCERNALEKIANLLISVFDTPKYVRKLALMLENEDYIKKLLKLFHTCENQQDTEGLHYLYTIVRGILFLNKISLFNIMFSDECIMDVVGCLEYNPDLAQPIRHREFLTQTVKFKEVIPITHFELRQKIHQTYRIQYINDILLPTPCIFEENLLSDLKSFIFFNKMEIVTMLQEDERFLSDVLAQLQDDTIDVDRRRDLFLFFKEFCAFSHTLESEKKDALLKILINLGIMPLLKAVLRMHDCQIRVAAIDIFSYLVEYSPYLVQAYTVEDVQECEDDDSLLINIIIEQMICDTDDEFSRAINLEQVLHSLFDPANMLTAPNERQGNDFLNFFYVRSMHKLAAPLLSIEAQDNGEDNLILKNDRGEIFPDNYQSAELLGLILELLTFCVQHHTFYIRKFILTKNLLKSVLVLMTSKHTFLVLGALRFMRKIIGLKNECYYRYIIKNNLFKPVVRAFVLNGSRYNMLNSAIIELFEFIRMENIKTLIVHVVENFHAAFETTEYVQTFKRLKIMCEEEKEAQIKARNLYLMKCQKVDCRFIKDTEMKVKEEICIKENITEVVTESSESDILSHRDLFLQTEGEKENEDTAEQPERISSDVLRSSSSHSSDDANRMSRPHCSSNVALVDYSDDDDD